MEAGRKGGARGPSFNSREPRSGGALGPCPPPLLWRLKPEPPPGGRCRGREGRWGGDTNPWGGPSPASLPAPPPRLARLVPTISSSGPAGAGAGSGRGRAGAESGWGRGGRRWQSRGGTGASAATEGPCAGPVCWAPAPLAPLAPRACSPRRPPRSRPSRSRPPPPAPLPLPPPASLPRPPSRALPAFGRRLAEPRTSRAGAAGPGGAAGGRAGARTPRL